MLIHEMLEQTATKYPNKIAVKHGEETITFMGLNTQSARVAAFLYSVGIKEGDRVALGAKKNIETIINIFGILKAGAVYVPIDKTMPKERIKYIYNDCAVSTVLHYKNKYDYSFGAFKRHYVTRYNFNAEIGKNASAYIMYTSGSTGYPKGVEIRHSSVVNLMQWYCSEFNITQKDRILSFVPFWFDASICDIFAMAKTGATLVLPPEGLNMFPNEFAEFLATEQITLFFAPSSQFVSALPALKKFLYCDLKTVMFGAEELPVKYLNELKEVFKGCDLVNMYGPTECTDVTTFYRVPKQIPEDMQRIPIGKPYPGVRTEVVNDYGVPCGCNEIGELQIYGHNVMKGYWNNPEETKKVFKYDMFLPWYTTKDLVYEDKEGNYVYVGRKDRQIKSMGRRIQLEEIEYVLNAHPLIQEAVVVSIHNKYMESRIDINCFIVTSLTEREIIEYCMTKLPYYMIPVKITICGTLLKTETGKWDRRELK